MVTVKNWVEPPMAVASALRTFGTCMAPARFITWRAASAARTRPVTPIGLVQSVPPDGLTATAPFISNAPSSLRRCAVPLAQKPSDSSCGNWNELNGS